MAVKPLRDIIAAMGKMGTAERSARLAKEISDLGDDAPKVSLTAVLRKQMGRSFDLVLNMQLDIANELGLLPDGKAKAMAEMHEGLEFIELYALYEEMEAAEVEE